MITTESVANPKPVRECNWCGNPIKPGETYYGASTPLQRTASAPDASTVQVPVHVQVQRKAKRKRRANPWTAEKRAAFAERMRNYWLQRKGSHGNSATRPTPS